MTAVLAFLASVLTVLKGAQNAVVKHWRLFLAAAIVALVLFGGYCGYSAYVQRQIEKRDESLAPVDKAVSDGKISKDAVDTDTPKKEAQNASKRSNEALENVNRTRTVDSDTYDPDADAARKRFCDAYPSDDKCK